MAAVLMYGDPQSSQGSPLHSTVFVALPLLSGPGGPAEPDQGILSRDPLGVSEWSWGLRARLDSLV